ncbi:MAG: DUF421 domain-containing protein [Clostridia bacterium]|nr:DUF421 domain-containing protein [Clostridia bacterium]
MITIFFRTLLIYVILIATVRLMGKRQIGELEVTDLVTTLLLSEIAALPITDTNIPVSHALIPMITLLFLEVSSSVILIKLPKLKSLVSARPTVIISDGVLDQKALRSIRISMEELMGEIRQQGYTSIMQVNDAILEKNGKLTILPKSQFAPPTVEQMGLSPLDSPLMHVVLTKGHFNRAGLSLIRKDEAWLRDEIQRQGYSPDSLFCVTANQSGELLLIPLQETKRSKRP